MTSCVKRLLFLLILIKSWPAQAIPLEQIGCLIADIATLKDEAIDKEIRTQYEAARIQLPLVKPPPPNSNAARIRISQKPLVDFEEAWARLSFFRLLKTMKEILPVFEIELFSRVYIVQFELIRLQKPSQKQLQQLLDGTMELRQSEVKDFYLAIKQNKGRALQEFLIRKGLSPFDAEVIASTTQLDDLRNNRIFQIPHCCGAGGSMTCKTCPVGQLIQINRFTPLE